VTPVTPGDSSPVPARSVVREYLETILVCCLVLVFARAFLFVQSQVPTESMVGTLLIGDYILVDAHLYGAPGDSPVAWLGQRGIERGDVLVFRFPQDPDIDYVKRVVGLPGETVEVRQGRVYIDGRVLEEPYVDPRDLLARRDATPRKVPDGQYFMMGDNRDDSVDSRYWGFLPRPLVRGRAVAVFFSYDDEKNAHLNTGWRAIAATLRKIPHLATRTRWSRIGSRIR
jgi:signal peptidase I